VQLTSLDWVIVVVSLVLCYLPAMFYLRPSAPGIDPYHLLD